MWFELKVHHWEQQLILIMKWLKRGPKTYQSMYYLNVGILHTVCIEYKKVIQLYSHFCMLYKAVLLYNITQAWYHEMKQKISHACFFSNTCVFIQSPRFQAYQMQTKLKETVQMKTVIDPYIAWCSVEWDWNVFFNNEY